jgi:outer membrane protein OmpA-like peptidoglycan-associated protein
MSNFFSTFVLISAIALPAYAIAKEEANVKSDKPNEEVISINAEAKYNSLEDEKQTLGFLQQANEEEEETPVINQENDSAEELDQNEMMGEATEPLKASQLTTTTINYVLEFYPDDVVLDDEHKKILQDLAQELRRYPDAKAKINSKAYIIGKGYADSRRAALQRAIAVRKFLIDLEVSPLSMSINAYEDLETKLNAVDIVLEGVPETIEE